MNSLLNYFLESSISIAVFALFFILFLRQEKSFVFNRFYLLAGVLLSILLPFIHINIGQISSDLVASTIFLDPLESNSAFEKNDLPVFQFSAGCYLLITVVLLARLAYKSLYLTKKSRTGISNEDHRLVTLNNSGEVYTFLKTIFVGDQISAPERKLILRHELIHARERHSYDILFLEIVTALFWVNPVYYLIKQLARTNHEYLADAQAIINSDKNNYVQVLASHAVQKYGFILAHQFHTSSILKRINMINKQNSKIMRIKQILPFTLALTLLIVFGCEDAIQQLSEQDDITAAKTISDYVFINGAYDMVEEQPVPKNGMTGFYGWVKQNLKYPRQARRLGIEGRVFVQFVLNKSGQVTEVKAIKGIGGGCDKAAVDLIKKAANWTPGKINGEAVSVRIVLPISFNLPNG